MRYYSMIVLQPLETTQTISIMARSNNVVDQKDAIIRKDGQGNSQTLTGVTVTAREYYMDVDITSNILQEGETYTMEITSGGDLWYRDKIYVTSQNDYTVKHELAQPSYTEYSDVDDNTYII